MKKWLMLTFLLVAASAYASSIALNGLDDSSSCANCHATEYKNYTNSINSSDMAHKEMKITCIECHSNITTRLPAKELIIKAQLVSYSLVAFNIMLSSNFTFNRSFNVSDFHILRANCTKCHDANKINSSINHSNLSISEYVCTYEPSSKYMRRGNAAITSGPLKDNCLNVCAKCHPIHMVEPPDQTGNHTVIGFDRRIGIGGHKNLTCRDCHGADPTQLQELPQCTKCHTPHLEGAQWDRSICLGCHSDPHIPVRNATFKGDITKEMCSACHNNVYQTLTGEDSKHNYKVPACINCHPKHRVKKNCVLCHGRHIQFHPGAQCKNCMWVVKTCTACHTNPHAPLNGLPEISKAADWAELAQQAANKSKN